MLWSHDTTNVVACGQWVVTLTHFNTSKNELDTPNSDFPSFFLNLSTHFRFYFVQSLCPSLTHAQFVAVGPTITADGQTFVQPRSARPAASVHVTVTDALAV
jgi:hypothetical protein